MVKVLPETQKVSVSETPVEPVVTIKLLPATWYVPLLIVG